MTNYLAKAVRFSYYNMATGPNSFKTELVQPAQYASAAGNSSAGISTLNLLITCPTTNPQWFYAPTTTCELWLANNSPRFTATFVCSAGATTFYIPLRPTEIVVLPSNTTAITSILAGNVLNTAENVALPPPATTDVIPIDFVVVQ